MNTLQTRRKALTFAAAALGICIAAPQTSAEQASQFPTRPVRIVLPFPPGSVNDTITRILAERLTQVWKQPVTVDNRPGASSMIGTANVAQARPDGHTLLVNVTLMVQNPALREKMAYDPKALVPVTQINRQQLPISVRGDLAGIDSMTKLFAYVQARPGTVNFATWGSGSTAHIILKQMEKTKDLQMTHVPYKGGADILRAMLSGEADVAVGPDFISPREYFKSGRLRVIAVTGPQRVSSYPEAPTLAELGIAGFEGYNWLGMFAPTGTPEKVIEQIATDIAAVQADPQIARRFREEMFVEPTSTTPEEFRKIYERDTATWRAVIKSTGVTLD